jgi:hypothetical protein
MVGLARTENEDWGSRGPGFKSRQPDAVTRKFGESRMLLGLLVTTLSPEVLQ